MTRIRPLLAALLATVLLAGGAAAPGAATRLATGMDPDKAAAMDAALALVRKDLNTPGMSLAIRLPDGTVWTSVVGRAKVPPNAWNVTPETSFSAASITKTFVGAVVMQLVDEGKMKFNDRLSRWVPGYPNASRIRIRHLLNHTSGVRDYFAHPDYDRLVFGRPRHYWTMNEILSLDRQPLYFAPGTGIHYSNMGYALLGKVVKKVTGKTLGMLIRQRLLQPLGLNHTAFQDVEPVQLTSAEGYLRLNHEWVGWSDGSGYRPHTSAATVAWAAGAMLSTPSDLVRWAHVLYTGNVVSASSLARMVTFNEEDYGHGTEQFFTTDDEATREAMWGHSGSLRGFQAQMWYIPSRDVTISLVSNRGRQVLRPSIQKLLAVLFEDS